MTRVKNLVVRITARDNPDDVTVYDEVYDIAHYYQRGCTDKDDIMKLRLLRYKGEGVEPERIYIDLCMYNADIHAILEE